MPCCHRDSQGYQKSAARLFGVDNLGSAMDLVTFGEVSAVPGYSVRGRAIDSSITPQNRILCGTYDASAAAERDTNGLVQCKACQVQVQRPGVFVVPRVKSLKTLEAETRAENKRIQRDEKLTAAYHRAHRTSQPFRNQCVQTEPEPEPKSQADASLPVQSTWVSGFAVGVTASFSFAMCVGLLLRRAGSAHRV